MIHVSNKSNICFYLFFGFFHFFDLAALSVLAGYVEFILSCERPCFLQRLDLPFRVLEVEGVEGEIELYRLFLSVRGCFNLNRKPIERTGLFELFLVAFRQEIQRLLIIQRHEFVHELGKRLPVRMVLEPDPHDI
jgi:hypothetical protein